jgi:hypothetical protein
MIASNLSRVSAELPQKKDPIADAGAHGPMSQQDASDRHGHDMHPQKFVRLVGCHESGRRDPFPIGAQCPPRA